MTFVLLTLSAVILFFVGVASPNKATLIQHGTNKRADWLKDFTNRFRMPITWWAHGSTDFIRKVILKVTAWGKKTRKKLPF